MRQTLFLIFFLSAIAGYSQPSQKDSLLKLIAIAKDDTTKVNLLLELSDNYNRNLNPDSFFLYANKGLLIAQSAGYNEGVIESKKRIADYSWTIGDYATAIKLELPNIDYYKVKKDSLSLMFTYTGLLNAYRDQGDYKEALQYSFKVLQFVDQAPVKVGLGMSNAMIGSIYYGMDNLDSADYYLNRAVNYPHTIDMGWIYLTYGRIKAKQKNINEAFNYYRSGIEVLKDNGNTKDLAGAYVSTGELFNDINNTDSAIVYGQLALNIAKEKRFNKELLQAYLLLTNAYEKVDDKKAINFFHLAMNAKDSLFSQEKQRQILTYKFNDALQQQQLEKAHEEYRTYIKVYILLAALLAFVIIGFILYRNNRQKQKANKSLQHQKQKVETTLSELKSTQAQLIQSEKMASLGELTAGIAHEIQNPLNFVNNFSEVNNELIEELKSQKSTLKSEEQDELLNDIFENNEKINHHGKRADAIVKGMLQHSRQTSGTKEPTDINALCDEYLRLSYHGLRAKDKSFNADFTTDFDESIGKINIVPQDIGRVLLNLYNNAFYAVNEPSKSLKGEQYQPTVSVTTKKIENSVTITVSDNGNGIPQNIVDKIFQPFFTTKPTGQGTGLGLSRAYDIITKEHNGTIKVESKEGEGSLFTIILSANA